MKLEAALDEYELRERRRNRGEDRRQADLARAALREYLLEYSSFEETGELRAGDLFTFLLEYYPSQEEPETEVALALLDAAEALTLWLLERGERGLAPFAGAAERLREDLPRTIQAQAVLQEHARRDDLTPAVPLAEEDGDGDAGSLSSGVDRVAHLDRLDYGAAEEEYYTVREVEAGAVLLHSAEREALGEGLLRVLAPAPASELLRAGDILHAEVAPGPAGWELLEVFGVRPGGYV